MRIQHINNTDFKSTNKSSILNKYISVGLLSLVTAAGLFTTTTTLDSIAKENNYPTQSKMITGLNCWASAWALFGVIMSSRGIKQYRDEKKNFESMA